MVSLWKILLELLFGFVQGKKLRRTFAEGMENGRNEAIAAPIPWLMYAWSQEQHFEVSRDCCQKIWGCSVQGLMLCPFGEANDGVDLKMIPA